MRRISAQAVIVLEYQRRANFISVYSARGIELRDLLQSHEQQDILQARIFSALQGKREHHYLHIGDSGVRNHLASIGG